MKSIGKKILLFFTLFVLAVYYENVLANTNDENVLKAFRVITDENGHVPAQEYYEDNTSRSIYTTKVYDDKLFLGIGDYDANTGPVKMLYYDFKKDKIISSGTIDDEAVYDFNIIDNKLYTTGADPRADWKYASYYEYDSTNNKWIQHQLDGGWIHLYDIEKFNNKIFVSGSAHEIDFPGTSSIQSSEDGGKTFKAVPFKVNGKVLTDNDSRYRFYSLFIYNNELYGSMWSLTTSAIESGLFKYDANKNEFNKLCLPYFDEPFKGPENLAKKHVDHDDIFEFNGYHVYVSGNLIYRTKTFNVRKNSSITQCDFEKVLTNIKQGIADAILIGDTIYLLGVNQKSDKSYTVKIYKSKDLETHEEIYEFTTTSLPYSLEYYNRKLYISTVDDSGSKDYADFKAGKIEYSEAGSLYEVNVDFANQHLSFDKDLNVDRDNYIKNLNIGEKVSEIKNKINTTGKIDVYNQNKLVQNESNIGTGFEYRITFDGTTLKYVSVVKGDIDGNAMLSLSDIMKLAKQVYLSTPTLSGAYLQAADYDENGYHNLQDIMKLAKKIYLN